MRRHFVLARGRSCGCASSTPADTEGAGRAARAAAAARPGGHPRGAAVTQLRKAFANDDDNGQAYIETIAKSGYRLLVPVQVLEAPEPAMEIGEIADPPLALAGAAGPAQGAAGGRPVDAGGGDRADDAAAAPGPGGEFAGVCGCRERCPRDRQPAAALPADYRDQWF
ncbi:hypothetical protein G6F31_016648 [Rhizopus arrhizus]|nr:hypothetical protein G6F31_016648 [Rhizopus arrhizus]